MNQIHDQLLAELHHLFDLKIIDAEEAATKQQHQKQQQEHEKWPTQTNIWTCAGKDSSKMLTTWIWNCEIFAFFLPWKLTSIIHTHIPIL